MTLDQIMMFTSCSRVATETEKICQLRDLRETEELRAAARETGHEAALSVFLLFCCFQCE